MGRVAKLVASFALASLAACGSRSEMSSDDGGPSLLTPDAGHAGASGKGGATQAGTGGVAAGTGGSVAAGAGGTVGKTPCGTCVANNGPTGCSGLFAQCSGSPPCGALNACLVTNGCLESPDVFTCGDKFCPSFISGDAAWAAFGQCAVCLPACESACKTTGFVCKTTPPCAHGLCQTGAPLDPACDPCAAETCKQLPQCCNPTSSAGWTAECAMTAQSICGACFEK